MCASKAIPQIKQCAMKKKSKLLIFAGTTEVVV